MAQLKFKQTIAAIMVTASIRSEPPDEVFESVLWEYFGTYLKGFTFEDIRLAVLMNAAGELSTRVEHYQLLDINFISQVMEFYLTKKIEVKKRVQALIPPPPPPKEETPEECYNGLVSYLKKHDGEFPEYWAWSKVYDHMEDALMIEVTNQVKWELFESICERLEKQLSARQFELSTKEYSSELSRIDDDAKLECRKQMIKKFIKWQ